MKKEEYQERLKDIETEYRHKKHDLAKKFAFSNTDVVEGDIVKDNSGAIIVDQIKFTIGHTREKLPECIFYGYELTKKMKPRKDNSRGFVCQCNIIEHIKG